MLHVRWYRKKGMQAERLQSKRENHGLSPIVRLAGKITQAMIKGYLLICPNGILEL